MRQLKLMTGTMLLVLTSTLSVNSVNAQQSPTGNSSGNHSQMNMNVGQTPTQSAPVTTPTNTQVTPSQTPTQSAPVTTPTNTQVTPSQTQTAPGNTVTGTIRNINGQIVTVETANGTTQRMTVSRADIQRLNLQPGMQVTATVNAQSVASNITVAQSSTTTGTDATSQTGTSSTTTTGTDATSQTGTSSTTTTGTDATSQTGTSSTTDTEATTTTGTTPTTSTETEATTQTNDDTETQAPANRPVRALW